MSTSTIKERAETVAVSKTRASQTNPESHSKPETQASPELQTTPLTSTQKTVDAPHHLRHLQSNAPLSERLEMIRIISNRLFVALFTLLVITMAGGYLVWQNHNLSAGATNWMVILCGAIGGFISLQRRLKTLAADDLLLLARSWVYVLLSPLVGGILALLLYFLFISGLLQGDLFPDFYTDRLGQVTGIPLPTEAVTASKSGLNVLFEVKGVMYKDYAKLVFWCFLAGFSESFVTNILNQFESSADKPGPGAV